MLIAMETAAAINVRNIWNPNTTHQTCKPAPNLNAATRAEMQSKMAQQMAEMAEIRISFCWFSFMPGI
jgi:hypothetical protein